MDEVMIALNNALAQAKSEIAIQKKALAEVMKKYNIDIVIEQDKSVTIKEKKKNDNTGK